MNKKIMRVVKDAWVGIADKCERLVLSPRFGMTLVLCFMVTVVFGQDAAGDYTSGINAISTVTTEIAKYVPYVQGLLYAIAGVVGLGGAISVYIKMNNEESDVKKSIMMVVGSCVALIGLAQAVPLFFGIVGGSGE